MGGNHYVAPAHTDSALPLPYFTNPGAIQLKVEGQIVALERQFVRILARSCQMQLLH